jgi:hypothetical protein
MRKPISCLLIFISATISYEVVASENGILDFQNDFKKVSEKKSMDVDLDDTFKDKDKKSMDIDLKNTFNEKDDKSVEKKEVNVREVLKKDAEAAKELETKVQELTKLQAEAKKYDRKEISEPLGKLISSLKVLQLYHTSQNVEDKALSEAYKNFIDMKTTLQKVETQLKFAKLNTPEAKRIRKLHSLSKGYFRRASTEEKLGRKSKAKYYKTCAEITRNMALNYGKNSNVEAKGAEEINKAKTKYYEESSLESAKRFRDRAKFSRQNGDAEKAEYYDKVAEIKEKLSKAYAQGESSQVKSLNDQYQKLRKENKEN